MPESKIIRNGSAFLLEIDGKRMPLYGYMSYQPSCADYEGFRKAGVHLFFTGVYAGDRGINQYSGTRPFRPGFWKGYGQYDFSAVDEDFHIILDGAQPGVDYLIPRLMIEPPSWWEADNPGELCRDAQGTPIHHSYQSQKWLDDTRRMLFDFQAWLEDSGWAAWVPGWHIACGNTEEFIRPKQHPLQFTDYSEPARRAFAAWAQARYGGIAALNAAWNMKLNGFEDVTIPSPAQRMFGSDGRLRNPELERYTVDFYRFYNESHSQAAISLCRLAKEATGGRQVIGAFFGYTVCDQESGQHAANMVMQSDAVDFLASPFTYTDNRGQGVDWAFQGSVESAALHGKPWFMEADVRTYLSRPISQCMPYANPVVSKVYDSPVWWGPKDLAGSLGQMKKAFARVITHNTAVWWFDMWGGWYKDLNLMAFHKQAARIYRDHVEAGGSENAAPIALFMDDEIFDEVSGNDYASRMNGRMWKNLGYAGTPYRMFMMDDFEAVDPERFRLAVFCSVRHWSEGQKRALERWKRDDRVLAFTGPLDLRFVTGVAVETGDGLEPLPGEKNRCDPPLIARRLRLVAQPGDVVLSCAEDGGAVELIRRDADCSIYVTTAVDITADCARMLTAAAGGQIYTFDGDVAYASGKYVAVHAASDGVKRIAVPLRAVLRDVFTGEALPGNETFVDVEMKLGETRMLCIEPM
ncbi:MAG: beta-galactosidase [Clostridia bacterium]|nr:beta-galactosidase [Clostridia bacterium]